MAKKPLSPMMKNMLEYGPLVIFFGAFMLFKNQTVTLFGQDYSGFMFATAVFIPVLVLATLIGWALSGEVSKMQVFTVILVVVFGGMTLFFKDERFFKMKPTLIYLIFAAIMGFGLLRKTSYLETVLGQSIAMERAGWMIISRRITVFFLCLAAANEIIWRTQSTEIWVYFKTFGLTLALMAFMISQYRVFGTYAISKDDTGAK